MRKFLFVATTLLLIATSVLLWITEGSAPVSAPVATNVPAPAGEVIQPETSSESGEVQIGGVFTLTDQNGVKVSDSAFRGKLMLVFFGFTSCPDECPAAASAMTAAMAELGDKADGVAPLFISVDPARDTPAALKDFLSNFDKRFVGLTGSKEELKAAAATYKAYYAEAEGKSGNISHSAFIYLMSKDGKYLKHFPNNASGHDMAEAIKTYLN